MQWNQGPKTTKTFFSSLWDLEIQILDFIRTQRYIARGSVMWFIMSRNILQKQTKETREEKKNSYEFIGLALYCVSLARLEPCLPGFPSIYGSGLGLTRRKDMGGRVGRPKPGCSHCTWQVTYVASDLLEGAVQTAHCRLSSSVRAGSWTRSSSSSDRISNFSFSESQARHLRHSEVGGTSFFCKLPSLLGFHMVGIGYKFQFVLVFPPVCI